MSLQNIAIVTDTHTVLNGLITALTLQDKLASLDCALSIYIEQSLEPKSERQNQNAWYLVEQDLIQIFKTLGLSEDALIKHCDGNIHFGEMHKTVQADKVNLKQKFNSRAPLGVSISGVEFHHLLVQSQQKKQTIDESLVSYSLVGQLYTQNRFMPPSHDKRSIASSVEYGIVVNAKKLQEQLTYLCDKLGISTHQSSDLKLIKQSQVTPTYSEQALGKINVIALGSDDSAEHFPVDFVFDTRCNMSESTIDKLSQLTWTGEIEYKVKGQESDGCQHDIIKLNNGLAQIIQVNKQLTIELTLLGTEQKIKDASLADINTYLANTFSLDTERMSWQSTTKTQNMQCERLWSTNTIDLASVTATLNYLPMRRTAICDIIDLWLQFYPATFEEASETYAILSATFNQLALKYQRNLGDFESLLLLPHAANTSKGDGEYSKCYSPSLLARINLFEHTGTDYLTEQDCIAPHAWRNLALAMSYWPKNYDPVTNNIPNVPNIISNMVQQIKAASKQAPSLGQFLSSVAKAS